VKETQIALIAQISQKTSQERSDLLKKGFLWQFSAASAFPSLLP
jgi:hypothetical protein